MPSTDVATVYDLIQRQNWLHFSEPKIDYMLIKAENLNINTPDGIPVGSIEFTEKYLSIKKGIKKITPVFPSFMNSKNEFTKRYIRIGGRGALESAFSRRNSEQLFVKSASLLKCDYADFYEDVKSIPEDSLYLFSEPVDICSEWRCFINNGTLIGVRNYAGNPFIVPDEALISKAIKNIGIFDNSLKAYTLDVGVGNTRTLNDQTFVIEAHNFVSCGLYGSEDINIL